MSIMPSDILEKKYNIRVFRQNGLCLLVDPEGANWAVVNDDVISLLASIGDGATVEWIRKHYNSPDTDRSIGLLLDSGLVGAKGWPPRPKSAFIDPGRSFPALFVLKLNTICNLNCEHCRVDKSSPRTMGMDVLKRIVNEALRVESEKLMFGFHGGEPLLNFGLMRRAIEYLERRSALLDKDIMFSVQTNGTLITPDVADFFRLHDITAGVSFGGTERLNDLHRRRRGGGSSSADTLKGMDNLRRAGVTFGMSTVVFEPDDVPDVLSFMDEHRIPNVRFLPLITHGACKQGLNHSPAAQRKLAERMLDGVGDLIELYKTRGVRIVVDNILDFYDCLFRKKRRSMCMRSPCGAGNLMVCISPDGDIYPCDRFMGLTGMSLGNVMEVPRRALSELFTGHAVIKSIVERKVDIIGECKGCAWKHFCGGGCSSIALRDRGSLLNADGFCEYKKALFEGLIWKYAEDPSGMASWIRGCAHGQ